MLHPDLEYLIAPEHANEGNRENGMKGLACQRLPNGTDQPWFDGFQVRMASLMSSLAGC